MPRKWSKAVSEGSGPFPHQDLFGPDQPTMVDLHRIIEERFDKSGRYLDRMKSHFDQQDGKLEKLTKEIRATDKRFAGLKQNVRQPRLATEADVPSYKKTRKRTEDAAADRVIRGIALLPRSIPTRCV